jgi:hypothetical protein
MCPTKLDIVSKSYEEILNGDGMTPLMLHQLWSLVDRTQSHILLNLDDTSLVHWLIRSFRAERSLDRQQTDVLSTYIRSRLPLIRDVAQER